MPATYNPDMFARTALPLALRLLPALWMGAAMAAGPGSAPPPPDLSGFQAAAPVAARAASAATPAASRPVTQAASSPQAVVIEDRYTRIEELHERGEVRSIKVQPKGGRAYEILPATGGRDMSNSAGNGRGAAGQRVWPVLSF
jgi:hypothetical protein